jgi:hypothetical protein
VVSFRGIVQRTDVLDALATDLPHATAADLTFEDMSPLAGDLSLELALELLVGAGGALSVEAREGEADPRWITEQDALNAYTTALRTRDPKRQARRSPPSALSISTTPARDG